MFFFFIRCFAFYRVIDVCCIDVQLLYVGLSLLSKRVAGLFFFPFL